MNSSLLNHPCEREIRHWRHVGDQNPYENSLTSNAESVITSYLFVQPVTLVAALSEHNFLKCARKLTPIPRVFVSNLDFRHTTLGTKLSRNKAVPLLSPGAKSGDSNARSSSERIFLPLETRQRLRFGYT